MTPLVPRDPQFMSDYSKDATGCRLRLDWVGMSDEEYLSWEKYFERSIDQHFAEELEQGISNYHKWMERMDQIIRLGAGDLPTAVRWDIEAVCAQDADHYCYIHGLAYQMAPDFTEYVRRAA